MTTDYVLGAARAFGTALMARSPSAVLREFCVDACPTDSLKYGEWDDLLKDFGQEMLTPDFLPSPKITEPSLLILGGKKHV